MGVSQADVIYEILWRRGHHPNDGRVQDVAGAGEIGTVRSARDYYASLAYGLMRSASRRGQPQAYGVHQEPGRRCPGLRQRPLRAPCSAGPGRRRSAGLEHSVLPPARPSGAAHLPAGASGPRGGFRWAGPSRRVRRPEEAAEILTVPFSTYWTGVFEYDPDSGLYLVEEYGEPYVGREHRAGGGEKRAGALYRVPQLSRGQRAG